MDIKQRCVALGNPKLPKQESGEHNALADARWNRDMDKFLDQYELPKLVVGEFPDELDDETRDSLVRALKISSRTGIVLPMPDHPIERLDAVSKIKLPTDDK